MHAHARLGGHIPLGESPGTLAELLIMRARRTPDAPAVRLRDDGAWRTLTWREHAEAAHRLALVLAEHGVEAGARIAVCAPTSYGWALLDAAVALCDGALVPIYPEGSDADARHIVEHSGASRVVLADRQRELRWRKLGIVTNERPSLLLPELMRAAMQRSEPFPDGPKSRSKPTDLYTLVYTSGTTGLPKGVAISHRAICYEAQAIKQLELFRPSDLQLLFLPLSHIFARALCAGWYSVGFTTAFTTADDLQSRLPEVRPTVLGAVPRVFEKIYEALDRRRRSGGPLQRFLLAHALSDNTGVATAVARALVGRKVRRGLGGRLRVIPVGGAALQPHIGRFFASLGLNLIEGYGLTETCGAIVSNPANETIFGTVGRPFSGTEIRIASDGEVLVRSPAVMDGYWRDPDATAQAFDGPWLRTGDLGRLDDSGHLRIVDRRKDIIVTASGKNIAPQKIEALLAAHPRVEHAVVVGHGRKYVGALLTLAPEVDSATAGAPRSAPAPNGVDSAVEAHVARVNGGLGRHEQVKRFRILPERLTIEAGLLTAKLSVKRKAVAHRFAAEIDALYETPARLSPAGR